MHFKIPKNDFKNFDVSNCFLKINFENDNEKINNHFFLSKPKDLKLFKSNIKIKKIDDKTIEITTDVLAKDVFLSAKNINFSDNFFDLLPNEKIIITSEKNIDFDNIKIMTLNEIN